MGLVAKRLGVPLMPWQQYVADVILEVDPATGLLAYQEWGLTVPRQSGKSILILAKACHRASATGFFGRRQHIVYTAQTRGKAREKFYEEYAPLVEGSATFAARAKAKWATGDEHIRFANGSRFGIESNTEKAGHGPVLDEAMIDEAFSHVDFRLEQAFGPAMITRPNSQLGWISTEGWIERSQYLHAKMRVGRAAVESGRTSGLAYFEWSAHPDADPGDEEVWADCMPALGIVRADGTGITVDGIRAEYQKAVDGGNVNEFVRPYLNIAVSKGTGDVGAIPGEVWAETEDPDSGMSRVSAFAVELDIAREWASIGAAGPYCDCAPPLAPCEPGRIHVELVERMAGTERVVARCAELAATEAALRGTSPSSIPFVVDTFGAAASLISALEAAGLLVVQARTADVAHAYGLFMDGLAERTIRHGPQATLAAAAASAKVRPCGDGGSAFGRRKSGADIGPLVAVELAYWRAVECPPVDILSTIW